MLRVDKLSSGYGSGVVVRNISFNVKEGEIIGFIGRNGVGKTTLIKTILGLVVAKSGSIFFDNKDITKLPPYRRANFGIGYIPQGRGIFSKLTVQENLQIGELINKENRIKNKNNFIDFIYEYFPIIKERKNQLAGTLSGGEQQILAIGRAVIGVPKLLLVDEPSEGIQPNLVYYLGEIFKNLSKKKRITIVLVEQNIGLVKAVANYSYVMEKGEIVKELSKNDLANNNLLKKYLAI